MYASKSPNGDGPVPEVLDPVCTTPPAEDKNGDCVVDLLDLVIFTDGWLDCGWDKGC